MLQGHRSAWMTQLTSQFRTQSNLTSLVLMKKANIVPLLSLHLQVSSLLIFTCTVVRSTIGAAAATLRTLHSAMANASGS